MKFTNVAEAFNHYKNMTLKDIESRAAEIKQTIDHDPKADVETLNMELDGLKQAKDNIEERSQKGGTRYNPVTGTDFTQQTATVPTGDVFASAEYRSAFYKTLLGQTLTDVETKTYDKALDLAEKRTSVFSTTANSASVLPTQTLNEVISKARTMGGLISHCRNFNIPTKLAVPIGTPTDKATWHVEGAAVDTDKPVVTHVSFGGYELIKIFSISVAARKMSIDAFESYIVDELVNCIMEAIADAMVNGDGDGKGTGILEGVTWTAANTVEFENDGAPEYADFTKMLAKLKRGYNAGAKFVMNNATLYNRCYGLVDSLNRPIFIADPKNESIGRILGKEVVIDDHLDDDVILLGNWNYMGYNLPEGLMIEVSRESSFKQGLVDYRAMAIADTKPLVPEAFVMMTEADPA